MLVAFADFCEDTAMRKPFRAVQRQEKDFIASTIGCHLLVRFPDGVKGIYGQKRKGLQMALISIEFSPELWTRKEAREWLEAHGYKTRLSTVKEGSPAAKIATLKTGKTGRKP